MNNNKKPYSKPTLKAYAYELQKMIATSTEVYNEVSTNEAYTRECRGSWGDLWEKSED